jgi:FMN phosphatase YigB (HAD superfamily)
VIAHIKAPAVPLTLEPTLSPTSLTAVTFDFWDTLVHAPQDVATRVMRAQDLADALVGAGLPTEPAALDVAIDEVRRAFDRAWSGNRQFHAPDAVAVLLASLGEDAVGISDAGRAALVRVVQGDDRQIPALTPNVAGALERLKAGGVRLGVVCDVGFAPSSVLRGHLRHHGVLHLFDHFSFSDEVGAYKPHAAIFRHALSGLGVDDPGTAAHIGDLRRTDVAGARAFGMVTVRYTGSNDDDGIPPDGDRAQRGRSSELEAADHVEADHVVADHADLPTLLGIA